MNRGYIFENIDEAKDDFTFQYEKYKEVKNAPTIASFVKSLKPVVSGGYTDNKVDEVMFGACRMGDRNDLSYLAEEINIPVSGQSNASWGTGEIDKIGNRPNERFFVRGRDAVGIQFLPDRRDFNVLQTTSEFKDNKYSETSNDMKSSLGWSGGYFEEYESS